MSGVGAGDEQAVSETTTQPVRESRRARRTHRTVPGVRRTAHGRLMAAGTESVTVPGMAARDPDTDHVFRQMTEQLEAEFSEVEKRVRGRGGVIRYWALVTVLVGGGLVVGLRQPVIGTFILAGAVWAADRALR